MESQRTSLEDALARTESDVDAALKAAVATASQLKRAKKAAAAGVLRDLERTLDAAEQLAGALRDSVRAARAGWSFDDRDYLESGAFVQEVLQLGHARGLQLDEQDDRIVSYPSLVRILPNDAAIEIDRKRQRGIRPSVVVEALRATQGRPPRFRPEGFIEALARAYRFVLGAQAKEAGATVKLIDVYRVLTVLPGQSAAYSQQELVRDIYLLDESGVDRTKDGSRMTLPASSGARTSGTLATVMRNGDLKIYYGIAFR